MRRFSRVLLWVIIVSQILSFSPHVFGQLYWRTDGTSSTWTGSNWSNPASSTGGSPWVSNSDAIFTKNSTVTFATTSIGNVTVGDGISVKVTAAGTLSTGSFIRAFYIGAGSTLTWSSQTVTSSSSGVGFIKNGPGDFTMGAWTPAYNGGFTLNEGKVIVTGYKSFGLGPMTINGGTIETNDNLAYAVTSLSLLGSVTFSGIGFCSWNMPVNLGSTTRILTNNCTAGSQNFSGVISGTSGAGLTFNAPGSTGGAIILSAANTYTGITTINAGVVKFSNSGGNTIPATNDVVLNGGILEIASNQTLNNLTVAEGSTLKIDPGITLTINGTLSQNRGSIVLSGTGNGLISYGPSSTLVYGAASRPTATGAEFPASSGPHNLTIDNPSGVNLGFDGRSISGTLSLNSGILDNSSNNLTLADGVTIYRSAGSLSAAPTFAGNVNVVYQNTGSTTYSGFEIPASTTALNNLSLGSNVSLSDNTYLNGTLSFAGSNLQLTTNDKLILRSTASNTARIADITNNGVNSGNSISGNVTVERFIGSPSAKQAWRLLTAPLKSSSANVSIFSSWQNNGVNTAGIGTYITGPGGSSATTGIDDFSSRPSMQSFDHTIDQNLHGVSDTKNTPLFTTAPSAANKSYFVFVYGDRNSSHAPTSTTARTTTLSATGELQTGDQTFTISTTANANTLIGNPYASPVDFNKFRVANSASNVKSTYWYWDPNVSGAYGVGGYVTVSYDDFGAVTITPSAAAHTSYLQSGQAFFLETKSDASGTASVTFKEDQKTTTTENAVFRNASSLDNFTVGLYASNNQGSVQLDEIITAFKDGYNIAIDDYDAGKFYNVDEGIAWMRNNTPLSIERRPSIIQNDTLFIRMRNMKAGVPYTLQLKPEFSAQAASAFLIDKYIPGKITIVDMTSTTNYDFVVNNDIASAVPDRFQIILSPLSTLPVSITDLKASHTNNNVQLSWATTNEVNIEHYEIEKSSDGNKFIKTASIDAKGNSSNKYNWFDNDLASGIFYYRIKVVGKENESSFTRSVKVIIGKAKASISVYPNPVTFKTVNLQLTELEKGEYTVRIMNSLGQVVQTKAFVFDGGSTNTTIYLEKNIPPGNYALQLIHQGENLYNQNILVQ